MLTLIGCIVTGYLAGSTPTAIWVTRAVKGIDIRQHGSGNAGATNVARVIGLGWGVLVGVADILKGLLPVLILAPVAAKDLGISPTDAGLTIGVAAILGHLYPIFGGFKGGKGVLTALGVFLALLPLEAGIGTAVWAVVFAISRIVSLSSIVAVLAFAASVLARKYLLGIGHPVSIVYAAILLSIMVIVTHRSNIRRLVNGTEVRFQRKNGLSKHIGV